MVSKIEVEELNEKVNRSKELMDTHIMLEITELNDKLDTANEEIIDVRNKVQVMMVVEEIVNAVEALSEEKGVLKKIEADLRNEIVRGVKSEAVANAALDVMQSTVIKLKENVKNSEDRLELLKKEIDDEVVKSEAHRTIVDATLKAVELKLSNELK
eukprot:TRINITY_DN11983_c0_g1_i4.p1 TRINITY_DN11983_c0_g1~~TRINITY_DN11983_c0_g1_i4.p1  ORF type:complete len:157 (-),score=61.21 TRINITY_DN11983_c0_g1_i4:118-588(-)